MSHFSTSPSTLSLGSSPALPSEPSLVFEWLNRHFYQKYPWSKALNRAQFALKLPLNSPKKVVQEDFQSILNKCLNDLEEEETDLTLFHRAATADKVRLQSLVRGSAGYGLAKELGEGIIPLLELFKVRFVKILAEQFHPTEGLLVRHLELEIERFGDDLLVWEKRHGKKVCTFNMAYAVMLERLSSSYFEQTARKVNEEWCFLMLQVSQALHYRWSAAGLGESPNLEVKPHFNKPSEGHIPIYFRETVDLTANGAGGMTTQLLGALRLPVSILMWLTPLIYLGFAAREDLMQGLQRHAPVIVCLVVGNLIWAARSVWTQTRNSHHIKREELLLRARKNLLDRAKQYALKLSKDLESLTGACLEELKKEAEAAIAMTLEQHRLRESETRTRLEDLELLLRTAAERSKQIVEARRSLAKSLEIAITSTSLAQIPS